MALTRINNQALTNVTSAGIISSLPAGSIIQTKVYGQSSTVTATTDGNTATGISLQITPTFQNSKFLITLTGGSQHNNSSSAQGVTSLYRSIGSGSATFIKYLDAHFDQSMRLPHSGAYYDTPDTTSQITYYLYGRERGAGHSYHIHQNEGGISGIMYFIVQEIKQ